MQERVFAFFIFYFLWIFERRYPHIESIFAVGVRVRPEGKGGLFDDNLPPILSSRPVLLSHLIQPHRITRAYHQSEILPPPLLGWARRWSEPEKKRRREMKREGILPRRAAGKSFAEGRSFNGNGRSVLQEGWPPWLVLVGRWRFVYISRGALSFLCPTSLPADRLEGRDRPAWCWLMTRLEEQYFAIVIQNYLRTICIPGTGL